MKQSEIDFCVRWLGFRDSDGNVWGGEYLYPDFAGAPAVAVRAASASGMTIYDLTPRGADLVASYEAALVLGLDIKADDGQRAYPPPEEWGPAADLVDCPDCDDGSIGIPVEYAANGGVLRVWPATCQRCKGSGQVEGLADVGRPLAGLADEVAKLNAGWVTGDDEIYSFLAQAHSAGFEVEVQATGDPGYMSLLGRGGRVTGIDDSLLPANIGTWCAIEGRSVDARGEYDRGIAPTITAVRRRVGKRARSRDLEWRQLTREVADGLVGKTFEARRNKNPTIYRHDRVGTLALDGHWWVRGVA